MSDMESMAFLLMVGLIGCGSFIGNGIRKGLMAVGRSIVRAAKIDSMARNNKFFVASGDGNDA